MKTKKTGRLYNLLGLIGLMFFTVSLYAQTRIAILDFELSDVTLAPNIPSEINRTAAIKGML